MNRHNLQPDRRFLKRRLPPLFLVLLAASIPLRAMALSSASYRITIDALSAGGGAVSSNTFVLSSLAGQPLVIGPVSSSGYDMYGGYYYILSLEETLKKTVTCPILDQTTVYAAFNGEGIRKSTDGGASWIAPTIPPGNSYIKGLVIHPVTRTTLFAASNGGGVYKSIDSGLTWSACADSGLTSLDCTTLAIDSDGILYVGTKGGIFSSTDNGATWTAKSSGLTVASDSPPVSIAVDGTALYAGLDGLGIFRSTDGGDVWTAASTQPGNLRVKAVVIGQDATTLFAATYGDGVYESTDSGDTWTPCGNSGLADLNVLSLASDADGRLYAGTEDGVFVSTDGGDNWTAMNSGMP